MEDSDYDKRQTDIFRNAMEFLISAFQKKRRYLADSELLAMAEDPDQTLLLIVETVADLGWQFLYKEDVFCIVRIKSTYLCGGDLIEALSKGDVRENSLQQR